MNFIAIVKIVVSLLPALIDAAKAIEDALPQGGAGAKKLEFIKALLQNAYDASDKTLGTFESIWPVLQNTITAVVNVFNSLGVFKKSS